MRETKGGKEQGRGGGERDGEWGLDKPPPSQSPEITILKKIKVKVKEAETMWEERGNFECDLVAPSQSLCARRETREERGQDSSTCASH
jgi:hypothetical protein